MSNTTHTPGPWKKTAIPGNIISKGVHVMGQDGATIAVVLGGTSEETKTNARLIAAAPDLLEAAQQVLSHKRGEDDWLILAVHCRVLEAAIAKAAVGEA